MPTTIDARGLACPQPVVLAKKAIDENTEIIVIVDNAFAVENIRRMAAKMACLFSMAEHAGEIREITLTRDGEKGQALPDGASPAAGRLLRP